MESQSLPPEKSAAEKAATSKKRKRQIRLSRDVVLFVAGLAGIFHETVVVHAERPSLLLLFAAMCGLPAYLRANGR